MRERVGDVWVVKTDMHEYCAPFILIVAEHGDKVLRVWFNGDGGSREMTCVWDTPKHPTVSYAYVWHSNVLDG